MPEPGAVSWLREDASVGVQARLDLMAVTVFRKEEAKEGKRAGGARGCGHGGSDGITMKIRARKSPRIGGGRKVQPDLKMGQADPATNQPT